MYVCVAGVLEVMKGMKELGVSPDTEMLITYVIPVFSSKEAAQQALKVKVQISEVIFVKK